MKRKKDSRYWIVDFFKWIFSSKERFAKFMLLLVILLGLSLFRKIIFPF